MKTLILALLTAVALAGCVVVPVEPAVGLPRAYINPPALVVVPERPYYGYGRGYGGGHGYRHYRPYRPYR